MIKGSIQEDITTVNIYVLFYPKYIPFISSLFYNQDNELIFLNLFMQIYIHCQFPLLWLLAFALCIEVLLCWVHKYLQLLYLLLDWSLYHYVVSFVSCNSLHFKVYFVWYEVCCSMFLFISICMEYLFPSAHLQSVCVPRSEVGLL